MTGDTNTIEQFIDRWGTAGGGERSNYQMFLTELCALVGLVTSVATPLSQYFLPRGWVSRMGIVVVAILVFCTPNKVGQMSPFSMEPDEY